MIASQIKQEDIDLSTQILCAYCKGVYVDPVQLPCGKNLCSNHVNELKEEQKQNKHFNCVFCKKDHQINDKENFPLNKAVDDLVKKCQVRATPVAELHKFATNSYEKLNKMVDEFVQISSTSESFIYDYFNELERKVDLKREQLIEEIHKISGKLMDEIGTQKNEILIQHEKRKKKETFERQKIEKVKVELDVYKKELRDYSINLNKWKSVQVETEDLQKDLQSKLENFKKELLCNKSVEFIEGLKRFDEKEIFGEIVVKENNQVLATEINPELIEFYKESEKFCSTNRWWYKVESYSDVGGIPSDYVEDLRKSLIDEYGFSAAMADHLINNSKEENLPKGLRTPELRKKNAKVIKQLKSHEGYFYVDEDYEDAMIVLENVNKNINSEFMVPVGYILWFTNLEITECD